MKLKVIFSTPARQYLFNVSDKDTRTRSTAQKMKLSIKNFFSKCDQILHGKLDFLCSGPPNCTSNVVINLLVLGD